MNFYVVTIHNMGDNEMKIFFKTTVLVAIAFVICLLGASRCVWAGASDFSTIISDTQTSKIRNLENIEKLFNMHISNNSLRVLYGAEDKVVAYYYKLEPTGYIIVDSITGEMIEYSRTSNNRLLDSSKSKLYYGGPLSYYVGLNNDSHMIKNVYDGTLLDKKELPEWAKLLLLFFIVD